MSYKKVAWHKKRTISVKEIIRLQPCPEYSRKKVTKLFAGRKRLTVKQVLALNIPKWDITWLLLHFFNTPTIKKIGYAVIRATKVKLPKHAWEIEYYASNKGFTKKGTERYDTFWTTHMFCEILSEHEESSEKLLAKILKRYARKTGLIK